MADLNETQDTKKDTARTSGATRRIVVQDVAREQMPKAVGRRLSTPEPYAQEPASRSAIVPKRSGNTKRVVMIAGGVVMVLIIVPAFALLLHSARNRQPPKSAATAATPEAVAPVLAATPEASAEATPEESPSIESPLSVEAAEVRLMTLQLASQISQKSGYEFGPEFVELVHKRTPEYVTEKPLLAARQYRHEINKSFRDEGLNPLIGYVLAMSRSKFDPLAAEKGIGIWQLPMSVARSQGYLDAENSSKLKVPETSAQIVASYTRQLLSTFEAEDFMYAIACFGMSLQEAGKLQARLLTTAPDTKSRRDIMKMIRAGVLTDDQVENIARFFAAGIVGENPQHFGLTGPQPFSSLY
ncbi:MAG TPA: hypothetical protein VFS77_14110 [Pyrinomonadaceae bacterium]|nr:hypothetical protein [Pyrinomonadaceae bacterium]